MFEIQENTAEATSLRETEKRYIMNDSFETTAQLGGGGFFALGVLGYGQDRALRYCFNCTGSWKSSLIITTGLT